MPSLAGLCILSIFVHYLTSASKCSLEFHVTENDSLESISTYIQNQAQSEEAENGFSKVTNIDLQYLTKLINTTDLWKPVQNSGDPNTLSVFVVSSKSTEKVPILLFNTSDHELLATYVGGPSILHKSRLARLLQEELEDISHCDENLDDTCELCELCRGCDENDNSHIILVERTITDTPPGSAQSPHAPPDGNGKIPIGAVAGASTAAGILIMALGSALGIWKLRSPDDVAAVVDFAKLDADQVPVERESTESVTYEMFC